MKSKNYNKVFNILKRKYFKYIELDPVIESKFILQRSGENFKKYLFSFYNSDGQELSLRPDLTISSVIRYAQSKSNKNVAFGHFQTTPLIANSAKKTQPRIGN